jgi:cytochrome c oxidase assembly factor 2
MVYADGEETPDGIQIPASQRRRRRRRCVESEGEQQRDTLKGDSMTVVAEEESGCSYDGEESVLARMQGSKPRRECPVPKPGGLVGELLGFKPPSRSDGDEKGAKPP